MTSSNISSSGPDKLVMFTLKSPNMYALCPFSAVRTFLYCVLKLASGLLGERYTTPTVTGSGTLVIVTNRDSNCSVQTDNFSITLKLKEL